MSLDFLKRTVGDSDWHFDSLKGSHLHSESDKSEKKCCYQLVAVVVQVYAYQKILKSTTKLYAGRTKNLVVEKGTQITGLYQNNHRKEGEKRNTTDEGSTNTRAKYI